LAQVIVPVKSGNDHGHVGRITEQDFLRTAAGQDHLAISSVPVARVADILPLVGPRRVVGQVATVQPGLALLYYNIMAPTVRSCAPVRGAGCSDLPVGTLPDPHALVQEALDGLRRFHVHDDDRRVICSGPHATPTRLRSRPGTQDSSITFSGAPTCVLGPGHSAVRGGCSVRHPQTATSVPRLQVPRGERQGCGGSTRVTSQTCTQAGGHGARAHACARENSLVRAALAAAGSHPVHGLRARTAGARRRRPRAPAGAGMRPRARVAAATAQTPMRPGRRRRPKLPAAPPQRKRSSRRVPPGGRRRSSASGGRGGDVISTSSRHSATARWTTSTCPRRRQHT